jgi:hypothetical protein
MHLCLPVAGPPVEGAKSLGGPSAKRADKLAIVLVRDLPRPVVELELLQGRQGTIAFLGELEAPALARVGLSEPILGSRETRLPQKRQRDDEDADDCQQDAEPEPDAHKANARRVVSGFGCGSGAPRWNSVPVFLAETAGRVLRERVAVTLAVGGAHERCNDLDVPLLDLSGFTPEIGEAKVDVELKQVDAAGALWHTKSVEPVSDSTSTASVVV